jgi:predicted transcriptional regulator
MKKSKSKNYFHDHEIIAFDNHALYYSDYCKIKNIVKEEIAIFTIKVTPQLCNSSNFMDYGVMITMIDGLSSFSQLFLSRIHKKKSLSVNLNLKIFHQLEEGKEYELSVKIYSENKKYTVFKCQILNENGELMSLATHVKRNIKPKF